MSNLGDQIRAATTDMSGISDPAKREAKGLACLRVAEIADAHPSCGSIMALAAVRPKIPGLTLEDRETASTRLAAAQR